MNRFKTFVLSVMAGLMIGLPLGMALHSTPVQAASNNSSGTISFFGEPVQGQPGTLICTLAFVTKEYIFNQMSECINDDAYYFQLNNVPSATVFGLYDGGECQENTNQNFYFVMKTMKNNLTMEKPILIADLILFQTGHIVPGSAGVRLEKKFADEKISGKLTCVKIKRSDTPN